MKIPKKRETRIEFIKRYLLQSSTLCAYCKYNTLNYKSMNELIRNFFHDKCNSCTNSMKYKHSDLNKNKYYWFNDHFKPLYDWEEIDSEGENNGNY